MIDFNAVDVEAIAFHQVGNKHHEADCYFSDRLFDGTEDEQSLLLAYFTKPFKELTEVYRFQHHIQLSMNELYMCAGNVFKANDFLEESVNIVKHLYDQSEHPHIKSGEVFVVKFNNVVYQNEMHEALGIFKAEKKEAFFNARQQSGELQLEIDKGIHAKKLDKGCIIMNRDAEEGYHVFSVDTNRYDSEYWKERFLNITYQKDHNYQTKSFISMCKDFSKEVIETHEGKKEQVNFMNQAMGYMATQEELNPGQFASDLFADEGSKEIFQDYQKKYVQENEEEWPERFEVSKSVLKEQKRKIKNQINLDTHIQIKLNFNNPESAERFMEKGYDEEKGMHYYKIYFNREE
ncbi:MAG: nucleoid-associated protein [Bacteroidales bacterium]